MDKIATSNKHFHKNKGFHERNIPERNYTGVFQKDLYSLLENELIDPPGRVVLRILEISKRTQEI